MKTISLIALMLVCFVCGFTQVKPLKVSDVITTKRVYMHYKGNTTRDSLVMPVVSDKYPKLKNALSEKVIFNGDDLKTVVKNYETEGNGTTGLSFEITYQDNSIISMILNYETMGAYPDSYQKRLTMNINTGTPYLITNEINEMGLRYVFNKYKSELSISLANAKKDMSKDKELSKDDANDITQSLKLSLDKLRPADIFKNFIFTPKGVMFTSDDVLPHVIRNYELGRDQLFPYATLHQYRNISAKVVK